MQDGMHVMQELSFPEGHSRALSSAHLTVRCTWVIGTYYWRIQGGR